MPDCHDLVGAIAEIDSWFSGMADQELLASTGLMEKRRSLIDLLAQSPSAKLRDLDTANESTARLAAKVRAARDTVVSTLASNRRSQNLVRALAEPASPQGAALFG